MATSDRPPKVFRQRAIGALVAVCIGCCAAMLLSEQIAVSVLFVVMGVAVVATFFSILIVEWLDGRRTAALSRVAEQLGCSLEPNGQPLLDDGLGELPLLKGRRGSRALNVLMSKDAARSTVAVFDHLFELKCHGGYYDHKHTLVAMQLPEAAEFPEFQMTPRTLGDRLLALVSHREIDFVDNPRFSKRYVVRGPDAQGVRDVFHEELLEHLATSEETCIEARGRWLCVYVPLGSVRWKQANCLIKPARIQNHMSSVMQLLKLFEPT